MELEEVGNSICWFVMRDLKRPNAKLPAYRLLSDRHFEVFTPMKWTLAVVRGKKTRKEIPVIQDLLFVHAEKEKLDSIVAVHSTLQYRYLKGGGYREPMTVREREMERFRRAVEVAEDLVIIFPKKSTLPCAGK